MVKKAGFIFIGLLFLLCQCGKRATTVDPAFIGIWHANDSVSTFQLSIDDHDNAFWQRDTHGNYVYAQGQAHILDGNHLHIGARRFIINEFPDYDSTTGIWTMILSDIPYTR